jgi:broad specificity phosphatase PhoE
VVARVAPRFDHWVARHQGEALLFVLHGDVIRALLYHVIGFPEAKIGDFEIAPCSLTEIIHEAQRYRIEKINDDAHLT